jgi:limonene-1,2-epoxide hydrolase
VPGVSVGRVRDGRIVENRDYWNLADYLQQVGLMPSPEEAIATGG